MVDTDKQAFAEWYTNLAIATRMPKADISARVIGVMFDTLKGLPAEAVQTAAADLQRTDQWMPTAARWAEVAEAVQTRARNSQLVVKLPHDTDPERTARTLAARKACIARVRAFPAHPLIDWPRVALALERMPFALPPDRYCDTCDDSGFAPQTCAPGSRCGRPICLMRADDPTYSHTYRSRCTCRPTNPHLCQLADTYEETRTTRAKAQRGRR